MKRFYDVFIYYVENNFRLNIVWRERWRQREAPLKKGSPLDPRMKRSREMTGFSTHQMCFLIHANVKTRG